jgi:dihydroxy-acid dehydratase
MIEFDARRRGVPVTKLNRRSRLITAGVERSPNRAMLRAVGFTDGDFEKPIVGHFVLLS